MRHDLCLYDDDDGMLRTMSPFLEMGLAGGEPAVVVLDRRKSELLADALGSDGDAISYIDRDTFYTRPEAALAGYDRRLRQFVRAGATGIRVFAELPRVKTQAELNSWLSYEAIVNRALTHHPLWIVCGYDRREVPEPLLEGGFETHQDVLTDQREHNAHYRMPEAVVRTRKPPPAALENLRALPIEAGFRGLRERVAAELAAAGVCESEAEDMVVATGEVLSNAQRHGGECVSVRVGRVGDRFVCEVSDDGPGIDDPLAGFLPPRPGHASGAGLWVARQLTRQLELVPSPHGFSVRLWAGIRG